MRFEETGIDGAWMVIMEPIGDERGFFSRTFCVNEFEEHGLDPRFVQHSVSHSALRHTLRGLHFQNPPHAETKFVSCIRGAILDVIVDLRPWSETYRQWRGFELNADNGRQLYIPKGFAHGFQTLRDDTMVSYLISEFHVPGAARGIPYDDPAIGVQWAAPPAVISEKDRQWPRMDEAMTA